MFNSVHKLCRLVQRCAPCVVLFLAFAFCSAAPGQQGGVHLVVRQTASVPLTLIKPTDANFDSMIDAYFPGLSQQEDYQQAIRPFLVIVRNDNGLPAVAYAVTWTAHYTPGWVRPLRRVFVNTHLMYRLAMTYIPPSAIRLISLRFNVTPRQYQANPYFAQANPAASYPPSNELSSVDVAFDGVIYNDGSFIGPDTTKVYERYAATRFAERDEAIAVLNFIKSSTERPLLAPQLYQSLKREAQRDRRADQNTLLARYVRARGQSARDIQRILKNRGVSGLQAMLQRLIGSSGRRDTPSMFDGLYRKVSANDPRVFTAYPSNSVPP